MDVRNGKRAKAAPKGLAIAPARQMVDWEGMGGAAAPSRNGGDPLSRGWGVARWGNASVRPKPHD
jgi:hypothetical protein